MSKKTKRAGKKNSKVTTVILVLIILAGLSLMLYPSFSNWWNQQHQTRAIAGYVKKTKDLSKVQKQKMWDEAVAYNEKLAQDQPSLNNLTKEQTKEYESVLDVTGTGVMGYVTIPKYNIELPIYHGVDEAILQIAIGHIAGSSLPVGGESTHCVISGHTGLPSARLFTDIDKMVEGDHFTLKVLDQVLTYEVDQIKTVLPEELDDVKIEKGKDLCTLVTCTPYGINTHRLLVRGHRVANDDTAVIVEEEGFETDYIGIGIIAVILAVVLGCAGHARRKRKLRRRLKRAEKAEADPAKAQKPEV